MRAPPFAVVDLEPVWEMAVAAVGFGLGATLALTAAVAGFSQAQQARELGRRASGLLYLALGAFGALALTGIVLFGLILLARS